jgi:hypothetical protein
VRHQVAQLGGNVAHTSEPAHPQDQQDATGSENPQRLDDSSLGIHVMEHHRHGHGVERVFGKCQGVRRRDGVVLPPARFGQHRLVGVDADNEAVLARDEPTERAVSAADVEDPFG